MPSLIPVVVSAAVLLCAAVVASAWPASRAARIDVMNGALQTDGSAGSCRRFSRRHRHFGGLSAVSKARTAHFQTPIVWQTFAHCRIIPGSFMAKNARISPVQMNPLNFSTAASS